MGLSIKGEFDSENRFQVYAVEKRHASSEWDIFIEQIGVVDHINTHKSLLHFIVSRDLDGVIRFADLDDRFDEGDAIAVRVSTYTSKQGTRYRTLTSNKTAKPIHESLVKVFEDSVREDNGMGFTNDDIFIPPPIVKAYGIKDDDRVSGKAILNYNKKRLEWGWKAISIDSVRCEIG